MITATEDGAFRVSCLELDCPRPLMRIVASAAHAGNLERKHEREFHGASDVDTVTELAADIRALDGSHSLGAGALAEALVSRGWIRAPF